MRGWSYKEVYDKSVERCDDAEDSVAKSKARGKLDAGESQENNGHIQEGLVATRT